MERRLLSLPHAEPVEARGSGTPIPVFPAQAGTQNRSLQR